MGVLGDVDMFPVIQPGTTHSLVVGGEAKGVHEMKMGLYSKTESANITRVGPNFWFNQGNVKEWLAQSLLPLRHCGTLTDNDSSRCDELTADPIPRGEDFNDHIVQRWVGDGDHRYSLM